MEHMLPLWLQQQEKLAAEALDEMTRIWQHAQEGTPLERSTGILGGLYHLRQMLDMLAAVARDVKRTSEADDDHR